jgi:hypothetical protein
MHHVAITRSGYDFDANQWQTETVCSFDVGSQGIERVFEGDEQIPRRVEVLDIDNGRSVTLESELLPSAFRSGELAIAVDVDRAEIETHSEKTLPAEAVASAETQATSSQARPAVA